MDATVSSTCPQCAASLRCGMVRRDGPPQASTDPKLSERGSAPPMAHEAKSVGAISLKDSTCWCFDMPRVISVPTEERAISTSCLCPTCLQDLIDSNDLPPSRD